MLVVVLVVVVVVVVVVVAGHFQFTDYSGQEPDDQRDTSEIQAWARPLHRRKGGRF